MDNVNFVKTSDKTTALLLREAGFQEITETGTGMYVFVNNGSMKFEEIESFGNLQFTNKLNI